MIAFALLAATAGALAQAPVAPAEFPTDAKSLPAEMLQQRIAGKSFGVKPAKGAAWKLQYEAGGSFTLKTASGYEDTGKWRVEGSQLCTEPSKTRAACNDMRLVGDALFMKRDSGEIVKFEPN
jgi:hypothetical protein